MVETPLGYYYYYFRTEVRSLEPLVTDAGFPFHTIATSKKQIKEEKERKNNRRESLPRSDRRGGEKIKQEQKQKQRPAKHIREVKK